VHRHPEHREGCRRRRPPNSAVRDGTAAGMSGPCSLRVTPRAADNQQLGPFWLVSEVR
jgi:hypothetical protein